MTEWIPIATMTVAIFTGIFFLARWFKDDLEHQLTDIRTEVDDELKEYRHDIKNVWLKVGEHAIAIVALQTEQRNTSAQLTDIKAETRAIAAKLDALAKEITDMLVFVKITAGGVK